MKDLLYYQVQQLLINNDITLDKKELAFQIQSHPSYPSLHAVTGVLDHFNIDNVALDIPINKETLIQLPNSFLAQIKIDQREEFAVVVKKETGYHIIHSKKKKDQLSATEFLDVFTGIIVAVEKTNLIEEQKDNSSFTNNSLIIMTALILCSLFFLAKPSIVISLFFGTSLLGIIISFTLKKQEQGVQTVLGNAFCSEASEKKDCDAVLTSKGANVFGKYKLSDISLIYFSGLVLSVFMLTSFNINLSLTFAVSLLAFPITLYSIYYQAAVIKKWCLLCLSVVTILLVQVIFAVLEFEEITLSSVSINNLLVTVLGFLSALTIWNTLEPKLMALKNLKQIEIEYFRFKRNFNLFNTLLKNSNTIDTTIGDVSEIIFGNPNSNLEITIVTSPFCGHCKPVHTLIEDILKKHGKEVKIQIRFKANTRNLDTSLVKIASRLLEIFHNKGTTACLNAMHKIYAGQNSDEWINEFGVCSNKEYLNILEKENSWIKVNALNFTPAILINGKSFPKEYKRTDLIYFIEELHENCNIKEIAKVLRKTEKSLV